MANVAGALANQATISGSRKQVVECGAVPPLVKLCNSSQSYPVLISSALALSALVIHEVDSLEPEIAESALQGLRRVETSFTHSMPPPLQTPLAQALEILGERTDRSNFIV